MDNCLIIYYSIFILVMFIIIKKQFKQNIIFSVGLTIIICILYIILNKSNVNIENNLEILTDMPNF